MSGKSSHAPRFEERIIRDAQICGGEPVFKGTRITLRTVLASLAAGGYIRRNPWRFPRFKT